MSILSWNCRGAGKVATVRELRDLARKFAPTMLCIVETQLDRSRVENLASTLALIMLMLLVVRAAMDAWEFSGIIQ